MKAINLISKYGKDYKTKANIIEKIIIELYLFRLRRKLKKMLDQETKDKILEMFHKY